LISLRDNKFYIGHTNNLDDRIRRHNGGYVKATKNRRPLKLIDYKSFGSRSDAVKYELYLKSLKGSKRFKEIIGYNS